MNRGLQREDEILGFRNGCSMGHWAPYIRGMGWVSYEMWLSLARLQQGLGLLLDTETFVIGAW